MGPWSMTVRNLDGTGCFAGCGWGGGGEVRVFDSVHLRAPLGPTRPVPLKRPPALARPAAFFVRVLSLWWSFDAVFRD